jgi:hypothetical protein
MHRSLKYVTMSGMASANVIKLLDFLKLYSLHIYQACVREGILRSSKGLVDPSVATLGLDELNALATQPWHNELSTLEAMESGENDGCLGALFAHTDDFFFQYS